MNDIKKALDSGMKNVHFNQSRVLNNSKSRKYAVINKIAVTMAAFTLITVCITTEAAQAALTYVYHSIANIMEMGDKVEEYTTVVGKSVTDREITVTLNDVIVSEEKLILSLNFTDGNILSKKGSQLFSSNNVKVYIDGNEIPITGSSGTGHRLDEVTYNQITEYYIGSIYAEKEHEFSIAISEINQGNIDVSGNWSFDFKADGKTMAADTNVVSLDNVLKYNGYDIIFEKYVSNSYEKLLYVTYSDGVGYGDRGSSFDLIGYDDLGNEVKLYAQPNYNDKLGTLFICWGGTEISNQARTLTLQAVQEYPYEFDVSKEHVTINIK